jgi:hypothetical protein
MPSRKGKGRQSLGFGRKSQRAAFHQEWQQRLQEDYYKYEQPRNKQHNTTKSTSMLSSRGTSTRTNTTSTSCTKSLRRLIAERQYWDRAEDAQQQQRLQQKTKTMSSSQHMSPVGWILTSTDSNSDEEDFGQEFLLSTTTTTTTKNTKRFPTLQSLALMQLAKSLPDYLEAMGVEQLHRYLSLLPGPALSILSIQLSRAGTMTNDLCQVLARHAHLQRLSLVAAAAYDPTTTTTNNTGMEEETDPSWKEWQPNIALLRLLPHYNNNNNNKMSAVTAFLLAENEDHEILSLASSTDPNNNNNHNKTEKRGLVLHPTNDVVPESWEDLLNDDDDDGTDEPFSSVPSSLWRSSSSFGTSGCCQLERLELGNMPYLQVHVLHQVLVMCAPRLTHLGLCGSLSFDGCGPDVLWNLSQWVPQLQVLDVSGNNSWVTEPLLRRVYESYRLLLGGNNNNNNNNNNCTTSTTTRDNGIISTTTTNHKKEENDPMTLLGVPEQDPLVVDNDDNNDDAKIFGRNLIASSRQSSSWSNSKESSCFLQQQQQQQHNHHQQQQTQKQQCRLLIKATGCLPKSSQLLMEMQYGTLF